MSPRGTKRPRAAQAQPRDTGVPADPHVVDERPGSHEELVDARASLVGRRFGVQRVAWVTYSDGTIAFRVYPGGTS